MSMRAFGFDVRAGAPRRSHASSRRGEVLARLLGGRGLRFAFDARREVCRVAGSAGPFLRNVEVARAAVDLEHLVRDAVEHVTVVGHEEQPAREGGQPFLEVGDGVEVEVVGRLVEDERVPLAREQRGERDTLSSARPTAGRSARRARRPCRGATASLRPATRLDRGRRTPRRARCPPAAPAAAAARRPARCGRGARRPPRARGRRSSSRAACSCRSR